MTTSTNYGFGPPPFVLHLNQTAKIFIANGGYYIASVEVTPDLEVLSIDRDPAQQSVTVRAKAPSSTRDGASVVVLLTGSYTFYAYAGGTVFTVNNIGVAPGPYNVGARVPFVYDTVPNWLPPEQLDVAITRRGDFAPIVGQPDNYGVQIFSPGIYTATFGGPLADGKVFTSEPFEVRGPLVAGNSSCCLASAETATLTAAQLDYFGLFSWTDLDFSWGFRVNGVNVPTTDTATLSRSTGSEVTLTPASGLAVGRYDVTPTAWLSADPSRSVTSPMEIIVADGLTRWSDVQYVLIVPEGVQANRVDPGTNAAYQSMAVLADGRVISIPVHWILASNGDRCSFFDPITLGADKYAGGSFEADGGRVTLHAGSREFLTTEYLVAAVCDTATVLPIIVAYDLQGFVIAPLTVTPGSNTTLRATDAGGRPLLIHWYYHGSSQGVSMKVPRAFDGHHGSATATYHAALTPGDYRISGQAAALNSDGYLYLRFLVHVAADTLDAKPKRTPGADGSNLPGPPGEGGGPGTTTQPAPACAGDVYLHNGEETISATDLFVRGRGDIDFSMTRHYLSRVLYNGRLGHGWDFDYNEHLVLEANGDATLVNGFGRADTFVRQPDGSFATPREFFRVLVREPGGSFVVRDRAGFKRRFDAAGKLSAYEDRNGNRLSFGYDSKGLLASATDPFGRVYTFAWRDDGRLSSVSDFAGRTVRYDYDANHDLVSVTTPAITGTSTGNDFPAGRTTRYTYTSGFADADLNHNLTTVTAPVEVASGGPPLLTIHYGEDLNDPLTYDKVVRVEKGGTNASGVAAGGTWTFAYHLGNVRDTDPDDPPPAEAVRWTTQTDPAGNVTEAWFDDRARLLEVEHETRGLRPGEPDCFCTHLEYNDASQVIRSRRALGNLTEYVHDSANPSIFARANVLEVRSIPDATRGGVPLVTRMTYEPLHNQIATITDPRGTSADFVPSVGPASAERYTTRLFYDYQEGAAPVPEAQQFGIDLSTVSRGLGDLNGDGRTDQVAGRVVLARAPSVTLLPGSNEARARGTTIQTVETQLAWDDAGDLLRSVGPEGDVSELAYFPENDPDGDGVAVPGAASTLPRGHLRAAVADATTSPRRRSARPPAALRTELRYDPLGRVAAVKNPRGVVSTLEWNAANQLVSTARATDVTAALASGQLLLDGQAFSYLTRFFYDANGWRTKVQVENRDGNVPELGPFVESTFEYDILGELLSATSHVDAQRTLTTSFRYSPNELLELVTKPEGNKVRIEHDERGLVFRVTRGYGATTVAPSTVQYNYDQNANVFEVLDPEHVRADGSPTRTTYQYDGFDRLTSVTDALGGKLVLGYDVASAVVKRQAFGHPAGRPQDPVVLLAEQRFSRDELSRVYQVDVPLFLAQGFSTRRPFEPHEGSLTPRDGLVTTRVEHDALSRRTFLVDDDRQTWQAKFDGVGRAFASLDPLGNLREIDFDQSSNPIRVRSTELSPERLVPNEVFETLYVWDSLDRLARVTDNAGQTASLSYDSRDNLIGTSDAVGQLVADPLNLYVRGRINGAGNTTHFFHDGLGRLVKKVMDLRVGGQGGNPRDLSNPASPTGTITQTYHWDGNSRLDGLFDDKGNATSYLFDDLDRPFREVAADGTFRTTEYDRDSNPIRSTDANGTVIARAFDDLNRLRAVTVTPSAVWSVGGTTSQGLDYDGLSRLTKASDTSNGRTSEVSFAYDSLSRVLEEVQDGHVVSSAWAGDGRRLALTYASGTRLGFNHDADKRLKAITEGRKSVAAWDWIGPGLRPLRRAVENGVTLSFLDDRNRTDVGWDAVQRVTRMRYLDRQGRAVVDLGYEYDRASNRTAEIRNHEGREDRFTYDSVYRLATATYDVALPLGPRQRDCDRDEDRGRNVLGLASEVFSFDGVNNRTSLVQSFAGHRSGDESSHERDEGRKHEKAEEKQKAPLTRTTAYGVNSVNEYTNVGGLAQKHDANGNLTDDGRFVYVYDFRNLLLELREKRSGRTAHYRYDALGRRIEKTFVRFEARDHEDDDDDRCEEGHRHEVSTRRYVFDGAQILEERGDHGSARKEWVYGVGLDEPVRMVVSHGRERRAFYYCQNAVGSVVALTDARGKVVERYHYQAFGQEVVLGPEGERRNGSAFGNPIRFQGRWRDFEEGSGLLYYRARFYSPETGRFTTRDPIGVWGDPSQLGNGYGAFGNNGVNRGDPFGLWPDWVDRSVAFLGKELQGAGAVLKEGVLVVVDTAVATSSLVTEQSIPYYSNTYNAASGALANGQSKTDVGTSIGVGVATAAPKAVYNVVNGYVEGATGSDITGQTHSEAQIAENMGAGLTVIGLTLAPLAKAPVPAAPATAARTAAITDMPFLEDWGFPDTSPVGIPTPASSSPLTEGVVYRGGSATPQNLTPRSGDVTGLSTFETLEQAVPPGGKAQVIDCSKLRQLTARPDAPPEGHVSLAPEIRGGVDASRLVEWMATREMGPTHPLTQELLDAIIRTEKRPK